MGPSAKAAVNTGIPDNIVTEERCHFSINWFLQGAKALAANEAKTAVRQVMATAAAFLPSAQS